MRDAAFTFREVAAARRKVDRRRAGPHEPHRHFGIEIETPRAPRLVERALQSCRRINAKTEKWIVDAGAQNLQAGEADAEFAPVQTFQRNFGPENRATEND